MEESRTEIMEVQGDELFMEATTYKGQERAKLGEPKIWQVAWSGWGFT